jgi:hypothetical protein
VEDWVIIDQRFNGPPSSANGGYTCGLIGTAIEAPSVRVSLRKPPPLAVPLLRRREDDGSVSLLGGDDVIATGAPAAVQAHAPPAPTVEDAEIATRRYVGFAHQRFPTCFVCGTAREDGLRIYAGQVGDGPLIASPWTPESDDPRFVWAVLDCPSAYAIASVDHRTQMVVLASLTVELRERPRAGEPHVVAAWPVAGEGRKHHSASALYDDPGHVLPVADSPLDRAARSRRLHPLKRDSRSPRRHGRPRDGARRSTAPRPCRVGDGKSSTPPLRAIRANSGGRTGARMALLPWSTSRRTDRANRGPGRLAAAAERAQQLRAGAVEAGEVGDIAGPRGRTAPGLRAAAPAVDPRRIAALATAVMRPTAGPP